MLIKLSSGFLIIKMYFWSNPLLIKIVLMTSLSETKVEFSDSVICKLLDWRLLYF